MDLVSIVLPVPVVNEGDNFTIKAYFRDRDSNTADAPSTVHYRIDCMTTGEVVQDWATVSAGESVAIALASDFNAIINSKNKSEIKRIIVVGDKDSTFQASAKANWTVKSLEIPS